MCVEIKCLFMMVLERQDAWGRAGFVFLSLGEVSAPELGGEAAAL